MANIRSLHDLPTNQPFPRSSNHANNNQANEESQHSIFMFGNGDNVSVYPPINKILAPNFKKNRYLIYLNLINSNKLLLKSNSFIFYVTILQIIMFCVELLVGSMISGEDGGAFVTRDKNKMGWFVIFIYESLINKKYKNILIFHKKVVLQVKH